jgi:GDP-L-fucose synthase
MPTNLYGPGDSYHSENSHVIPALIRKFHEAKINNQTTVNVWGTGTPRREFLYSDDMAEACMHLFELPEGQATSLFNEKLPPLINIGSGKDLTIKELASLVKETTGFQGEMVFDTAKPDGTMQKLMDVSKLNSLGWSAKVDLKNGLRLALNEFVALRANFT